MSLVLPFTDDRDSAGFWAAAREHRLVVQSCTACGHLRFPAHPYCPKCRSAGFEWHPVSGRGRIWSFVTVHKPILPAFADYVPYPVAIIELAEDARLRMTGNIVTGPDAPINSVPAEHIRIGAGVRAVFSKVADDVTLPRWVLA
jgi:uncharacterized OB-fold protein